MPPAENRRCDGPKPWGVTDVSDASIHPTTVTRFVDRLQEVFHEGDDGAGDKVIEAANVALLVEQYRAIARGDFSVVISQMADEIEFELRTPQEIPINGHWRGLPEVV